MRIVFMGTPDFAVPSLDALAANGYTPIAVATGPDKPRGRGRSLRPTPVKEAALRLGIDTILQPESVRDPAFAEAVAALEADLLVVVAFRILPPAVYEAARLGAFNLHGSLLPHYRGAAPINRAVMAGETETGVTTFFLQKQVDTGHIILKRTMPIGPNETATEVHDRMMHLGAEAVVETVRRIDAGTAVALPQDDTLATPAPKIFREHAEIDWTQPAQAVHNFIRGLAYYPAAWTTHDGTVLKLFRTALTEGEGQPGEVLDATDRLVVACGSGALSILEAQQPGKRRLPIGDFLRGYALEAGTNLR
ncbi:MAG: methionyl-tRNA formyltransferase [Rhodothermales bacterium]